jgi:hypothetical protein
MRGIHQFGPESSGQMLAGLSHAIYEAELVRSFINSTELADKIKTDKSISHRMTLINREIELLELKLARVRNRANVCSQPRIHHGAI